MGGGTSNGREGKGSLLVRRKGGKGGDRDEKGVEGNSLIVKVSKINTMTFWSVTIHFHGERFLPILLQAVIHS